MKDFKLPVAYNNLEEPTLVLPKEAFAKVDYYCPNCFSVVRLRESVLNNLHFFHLNIKGKCSLESLKHKLYKDFILGNKKFLTPDGNLLEFDYVEIEKKFYDIIPDIIGYIGNDVYLIEIVNKSNISEIKYEKIKKSNSICYKVYTNYDTPDLIYWHLFESTIYKEIVYNKQIKELEEKEKELEEKEKELEDLIKEYYKKFEQIENNFINKFNYKLNFSFKKKCNNGYDWYLSYDRTISVFIHPETLHLNIKIKKL